MEAWCASLERLLNPDSRPVHPSCKLEPSLESAEPGQRFQFERLGDFCVDTTVNGAPGARVFNQAVALRDA